MRQVIVFLLTLISLIIIGYQLYKESQFQEFKVSDNHFLVEKDAESYAKNESLQVLVNIRKRLDTLIEHLLRRYPNDKFILRMQERFNGTILKEANFDETNPKQSSYTINKGDLMVLCLRTSDGNMVDLNTLTYVAVHELAHIYSSTLHHSAEFWENMKFLVDEAVDAGVYTRINYAENPVRYCGIRIASNLPSRKPPASSQEEEKKSSK